MPWLCVDDLGFVRLSGMMSVALGSHNGVTTLEIVAYVEQARLIQRRSLCGHAIAAQLTA